MSSQYMSSLFVAKDHTFATFRVFLENEGFIDFEFDFSIAKDQICLLPIFERFNAIGREVYIICKCERTLDQLKRRRCDEATVVLDSTYEVLESLSFPDSKQDDGDPMLPNSSSKVRVDNAVKEETHLQSKLVCKEVMDKYRSAKEKIRKESA